MKEKQTPYSTMKIFHHTDILQNLKEKKRCIPLYIRIKPTNKCNHNCYYCHYKNSYLDLDQYNENDSIAYEKMMEIIEDISDMGVKAVTFSGGGEPLLYPYIEETMEKVLNKGIDLSIITNGSLLKEKKAELLAHAKWVRLSIESINDQQYCQLRGIKKGSFQLLCKNIKDFSLIKDKTCELGINFVVTKENYMQIKEMAFLMKELGVNHIKFAPLICNNTEEYHKPFQKIAMNELKKLEEQLSDESFQIVDLYTNDFNHNQVFTRTYNKCPIKEFSCVIAANAKVYYCHDKAYLSNGMIFDLNKVSFKNGWFSEDTERKFKEFDAMKFCKQHCVYDRRNELINSFLEMDVNQINFI